MEIALIVLCLVITWVAIELMESYIFGIAAGLFVSVVVGILYYVFSIMHVAAQNYAAHNAILMSKF